MPKQLQLISLRSEDTQDGGNGDQIRLRVLLDGKKVGSFESWSSFSIIPPNVFPRNFTYTFPSDISTLPMKFVASAEVVLEEIDYSNELFIDNDIDELMAIRELQVTPRDTEYVEALEGRGGRYVLRYRVVNAEPDYADITVPGYINGPTGAPPSGTTRGDWRQDKGDCRWICALDGGGMRGIITLRVLEQLEAYYGARCSTMFDMFAGTSTGALIAAGLATGIPVSSIIALYRAEPIRRYIFDSNESDQAETLKLLSIQETWGAQYVEELIDRFDNKDEIRTMLNELVDQVAPRVMTPSFRKEACRRILATLLSRNENGQRQFMTLSECKAPTDPAAGFNGAPRDLLITAHDMNRAETTFFSAFHGRKAGLTTIPPAGIPSAPAPVFGTYSDMRLIDAVEASMSAPTYFAPTERFVDGGVGSYNSPAFLAAVEALYFSNTDARMTTPFPYRQPFYQPYQVDPISGKKSGTVLWSFGTGTKVGGQEDTADEIAGRVSATRRSDTIAYWAEHVIDACLIDGAKQQNFLCRTILGDRLRYLRFNVEINADSLRELGVPTGLDQSFAERAARVKMAAVEPQDFEVLDDIGRFYAQGVRARSFGLDRGGIEFRDAYGWAEVTAAERKAATDDYARNVKDALTRRY